jgi:hypothetical protein
LLIVSVEETVRDSVPFDGVATFVPERIADDERWDVAVGVQEGVSKIVSVSVLLSDSVKLREKLIAVTVRDKDGLVVPVFESNGEFVFERNDRVLDLLSVIDQAAVCDIDSVMLVEGDPLTVSVGVVVDVGEPDTSGVKEKLRLIVFTDSDGVSVT